MHAYLDLKLAEVEQLEQEENEVKTGTMNISSLFNRFREWISQYVTWDERAIFKDPNWPHLWS